MGILFTDSQKKSIAAKIMQHLIPWLVGRGEAIVQNSEDASLLAKCGIPTKQIKFIRGSGINIKKFSPKKKEARPPLVMMASRLLIDKGVLEFIGAAKIINSAQKRARFVLVGEPDSDNPSSVSSKQIHEWVKQGLIEAWGHREDMNEVLSTATIFCLPSFYREGIPKVLLEAMACGLPCITTDSPGCRDAVRNEDNGLLVPIKNAPVLAEAICRLLENESLRKHMGRRGRERAVQEFADELVITQTLAAYKELLASEA
jgi:glycosyltransferase involved in cell wall biosynthesis